MDADAELTDPGDRMVAAAISDTTIQPSPCVRSRARSGQSAPEMSQTFAMSEEHC